MSNKRAKLSHDDVTELAIINDEDDSRAQERRERALAPHLAALLDQARAEIEQLKQQLAPKRQDFQPSETPIKVEELSMEERKEFLGLCSRLKLIDDECSRRMSKKQRRDVLQLLQDIQTSVEKYPKLLSTMDRHFDTLLGLLLRAGMWHNLRELGFDNEEKEDLLRTIDILINSNPHSLSWGKSKVFSTIINAMEPNGIGEEDPFHRFLIMILEQHPFVIAKFFINRPRDTPTELIQKFIMGHLSASQLIQIYSHYPRESDGKIAGVYPLHMMLEQYFFRWPQAQTVRQHGPDRPQQLYQVVEFMIEADPQLLATAKVSQYLSPPLYQTPLYIACACLKSIAFQAPQYRQALSKVCLRMIEVYPPAVHTEGIFGPNKDEVLFDLLTQRMYQIEEVRSVAVAMTKVFYPKPLPRRITGQVPYLRRVATKLTEEARFAGNCVRLICVKVMLEHQQSVDKPSASEEDVERAKAGPLVSAWVAKQLVKCETKVKAIRAIYPTLSIDNFF
jgi:hypothetical protein